MAIDWAGGSNSVANLSGLLFARTSSTIWRRLFRHIPCMSLRHRDSRPWRFMLFERMCHLVHLVESHTEILDLETAESHAIPPGVVYRALQKFPGHPSLLRFDLRARPMEPRHQLGRHPCCS
jgi:hypothetical protein